MKKTELKKTIDALKENGGSFVDEYEKICRQNHLIVDAGLGETVVMSADEKEISKNCGELRKSVERETRLFEFVFSEKTGRTPMMETSD